MHERTDSDEESSDEQELPPAKQVVPPAKPKSKGKGKSKSNAKNKKQKKTKKPKAQDSSLPPSPFPAKKEAKNKIPRPQAEYAEPVYRRNRKESNYFKFQQLLSQVFDEAGWEEEKKAIPQVQALVWWPFCNRQRRRVPLSRPPGSRW